MELWVKGGAKRVKGGAKRQRGGAMGVQKTLLCNQWQLVWSLQHQPHFLLYHICTQSCKNE